VFAQLLVDETDLAGLYIGTGLLPATVCEQVRENKCFPMIPLAPEDFHDIAPETRKGQFFMIVERWH
jgi:hypothetical protein